jgi:hypothetical protein
MIKCKIVKKNERNKFVRLNVELNEFIILMVYQNRFSHLHYIYIVCVNVFLNWVYHFLVMCISPLCHRHKWDLLGLKIYEKISSNL